MAAGPEQSAVLEWAIRHQKEEIIQTLISQDSLEPDQFTESAATAVQLFALRKALADPVFLADLPAAEDVLTLVRHMRATCDDSKLVDLLIQIPAQVLLSYLNCSFSMVAKLRLFHIVSGVLGSS